MKKLSESIKQKGIMNAFLYPVVGIKRSMLFIDHASEEVVDKHD